MDTKNESPQGVGTGDLLGVWECFSDPCYYDMWAVRRTHERGWGQCFHMNSAEEAKALTAMLNQASKLVNALDEIARHKWVSTVEEAMRGGFTPACAAESMRAIAVSVISSPNNRNQPTP